MVFLRGCGEGQKHFSIKEMKWKGRRCEGERLMDANNLSSDLNMVGAKRRLHSAQGAGK